MLDKHTSYTFALVGNPNVGKSTVFNSITGMNQHTGNWAGKTVDVCEGCFVRNGINCKLIDLPGSYSLSADSKEENVTNEFIESDDYSALIVVIDSNAVERNLNFAIQVLMQTNRVVICLNMVDIAEKNGISIDSDELSLMLGVPVIKVNADKKKGINKLLDVTMGVADKSITTFEVRSIRDLCKIKDNIKLAEQISAISGEIKEYCVSAAANDNIKQTKKLDRIFTSKVLGIPIMILFILSIFWITAYGANYPSELLSLIFDFLIESVSVLLTDLKAPPRLVSLICDGVLITTGWVVAVMLPPSLIFFPLFTLLEDSGYLPRIAFNTDGLFMKAGTSGKQILTMLMGFGCNACGVTGCRIISSPRERKIAILTNNFIPCNGRIPTLIALSSIFFAVSYSGFIKSLITALILFFIISFSVAVTLITTKILSKIYNTATASFIMELPEYKKPKFINGIVLSVKNKVISVVKRAVIVALPAGALIWIITNINIGDKNILSYITEFLNPFARYLGVDGTILAAFLLGFPANEIVIPFMMMSYTNSSGLCEISALSNLGELFLSNGWNNITAVCVLILCIFHFPCSTTCITIYKETKSKLITLLSIVIPSIIGIFLCFFINLVYHIFF